tara:strand:+ start:157 stop:501 length:345 start_codon:yes stop_codon:yes gene_type:complete
MAVYSSNLNIKTGTTFAQVFTLEDGVSNSPINLTNFGIAAQMRKHAGATTGITTFTTSLYDAVGGKIQIGLSTTQTAALKPGRHVYDVITTDTSGVMECVVEGMVIVSKAVTQT